MISGLQYINNFLSQSVHDYLLERVDAGVWLNDLKRRVQHYGYKYDYTLRAVNESMRIGPLPEWADHLGNQMVVLGFFDKPPDQLIINEYLPGQGIANHIDCVPCFKETIVSVSLGSPCVMNFTRKQEVIPLYLKPCSAVVLKGVARYQWMHGIPARKKDTYGEETFERSRRVSLTFRQVILNEKN